MHATVLSTKKKNLGLVEVDVEFSAYQNPVRRTFSCTKVEEWEQYVVQGGICISGICNREL